MEYDINRFYSSTLLGQVDKVVPELFVGERVRLVAPDPSVHLGERVPAVQRQDQIIRQTGNLKVSIKGWSKRWALSCVIPHQAMGESSHNLGPTFLFGHPCVTYTTHLTSTMMTWLGWRMRPEYFLRNFSWSPMLATGPSGGLSQSTATFLAPW